MTKYLIVAACLLVAGCGLKSIDVSGLELKVARITRMPAANLHASGTRELFNEPPAAIRLWFFNEDGSCVQCALGIVGVRNNNLRAATLLWNTSYGQAVRGGSSPGRVADYCRERGIRAYNVTGSTTFEWMKYAALTGRGAAIAADTKHFQTLVDYDPQLGVWYVCDNRTPERIDRYSEDGFRRLHLACMKWVVVLDGPAPPVPPRYAAR